MRTLLSWLCLTIGGLAWVAPAAGDDDIVGE